MSRWKASSIHLLISALVVGSVAAYIMYFWYPPALMPMAKADRLLMLIGGIDLIVGPLLTLIVYKAGKPSLKFDLSVIALLQIGFLAYGLHTVWNSRPVFLVAVPDRFELVFANEITEERLAEAQLPQYRRLGFAKPVLVGAAMPSDPEVQVSIMFSAIRGEGDIQTMPKYYVDYSLVKKGLLARAKSLSDRTQLSEHDIGILQDAAKSYGYLADEVRYVRLASSRNFAVMLLHADTGDIIGPVNLDP